MTYSRFYFNVEDPFLYKLQYPFLKTRTCTGEEEQDDVPDLIEYDLQETRTGTDLIDTEDSEIDDGSSPKSEEHEQDWEEEREQDLEEQDSNIRPFADDTKTLRSLKILSPMRK